MGTAVLIGGAVLVIGFWLFMRTPPGDLAHFIRTFGAAVGMLFASGLLYFGRVGLAIIMVVATFIAVRSLRKRRSAADPLDGNTSASTSQIETTLLKMSLDRASGDVDGLVKTGEFAGKMLSALTQIQLFRLVNEAQAEDLQSVALLEAYLDRRFPDWRQAADDFSDADARQTSTPGNQPMTAAKAYAVLGLEPGASEDDIKAAHRRLMRSAHPDHGGSDELARQINAARDFLLNS